MTGWEVVEERGSAAQLHGVRLPLPHHRLVRVALVDRPAVILGSTQVAGGLDPARAAALGVEVARRRSGGGAVLVRPGDQVWLDVGLPRTDALWDDDVGRSAAWLGEALATALVRLGAADAVAVQGPVLRTAWSAQVCFAGRAPGEVVVGNRKVVGTSQRRTRAGALFQVAVALVWEPDLLLEVLGLAGEARAPVTAAGIGLGELGAGVGAGDVVDAIVSTLPP